MKTINFISLKHYLWRGGRLTAPLIAAAALALLLPGLIWAATFITTVDTGTASALNDAGRAGSVALNSNGLAVISYWDMTAGNVGDLKVAFCNDPACSNPAIQTIGIMSGARSTSVAVTGSDVPVISYPGAGTMNVAICNSATDCSSPTIRAVDTTSSGLVQLGSHNSLSLNSNNFPVVSYDEFNSSVNLLKVAFCHDATCSSVTTRVVDGNGTTEDLGDYNSLALTGSDVPVISYGNNSSATLKIAICESDTDCSTPTINTVDDSGLVGQWTSLALTNSDEPMVSYYAASGDNLKLAVCSDTLCGSPVFSTTVDSAGNVGEYSSLALNSSGFPVISYLDVTNTALKLATCNDATCSSPALQTLDSNGRVGQYSSLALNSTDGPVISYYDIDNGNLKLYYDTSGCNTNSWAANNEASLNSAIGCFNDKSTAGTYTITVTQNITLTAGTATISNTVGGVELAIEGAGFAVDGQGTSGVRVFDIATDTTVTMNDLTVTGGNLLTGGALTPNVGAGLQNFGTLTIHNSTISGNSSYDLGGGIGNFGTLAIHNSTISGNTSQGQGGGLFNGRILAIGNGTLTIHNSTISGNTSQGQGGGLYTNIAATLDSVTISGNSAPVSGAGAGAYNGTLSITNTILAGNTGSQDCHRSTGATLTDGGHNLVQQPGNCAFTDGVTGNIVGQNPMLGPLANNGGDTETHSLLPGSPAIDAGSTTLPTDQRGMARPFGIMADIGAVEESCHISSWAVSDEAGLDAAIGCFNGKTTAGTYTITVTRNISLTAGTTTISNIASGVELAIEGAGFAVDGQGVAGVRPFKIGTDTDVTMNNLTVSGGNITGLGSGGGGILNHGNLALNNSTVSGNSTDNEGGGIENQTGTMTIINSTISGNQSVNNGGGILNNSVMTVNNSTISGNASTGATAGRGGGILNGGQGVLTIDSTTIAANTGGTTSGVNLNFGSTATISNSIIAGGVGGSNCGGIGGTLVDGGHNLVESQHETCNFNDGVNGTIVGVAPLLGPLADNGGSTQTHNPLAGSPAIDAGSTTLPTDQRGVARPFGIMADIGAVEYFLCNQDNWSVSTEIELGQAISCFNTKTASGTYVISMIQNINLAVGTNAIDNSASGVQLLIEGSGYTVDGQHIAGVRVFNIFTDTTVTINDLAVTGGNATDFGGGIYNRGSLTLNRSTVAGNTTGDEGGGIFNGGNIAINNSTISGNNAPDGGGIANAGTSMAINNSTVSGNSASTGGGIKNTAPLTLDSVTISDNTATVRGGGLYYLGINTLTVQNSILAGNNSPDAELNDCASLFGTLIDNGHNLIGNAFSGCQFNDGVNGTIVGVDPLLGPLADNGGSTQTHAPQSGSPAIDAGETNLTTDQRGSARPAGLADDIGAVETAAQGGTIIIKKSTVPAGAGGAGGAGFQFTTSGFAPDFTLKDGGKQVIHNVAFGTYTVTEEALPSGYELSGLTCTDSDSSGQASTGDVATRTATLNLEPGETVICSFTNTEDDVITVEKVTIPAGSDSFGFDGGSLGTFNAAMGQMQLFTNVTPGSYTLTEDDPAGAGYTLTGLSCVNSATGQTTTGDLASRSIDLNLTAGERVHCTFENTKLGTVIINKATAPAGGSGFSFSGSFGSFNLDDGGSKTIVNVMPGSYSVTEADPLGLGYELSGLTCTDSDSSGQASTGDVATRTATLNLEPGETVICSFTNTEDDVITVEKVTIPAGSDSFGFDGGSLGTFNAAMGQMQLFTNVTPGSYTLTEDDPSAAGYALTGLSCVDSATGQTTAGNLVSRSINLNLTAGERVHCTFENTKLGTVIINKATAPAGGSGFSFSGSFGNFNLDDGSSRTIANVTPGSYSVIESDPGALGYALSGLTCTDSNSSGQASTGNVATRTATINVDPGETVTCSFTNTQDDVITVEKVTIPAGSDSFGFDGGSLGAFTAAMGQMQVFTNVTPGSYTLTEDDPAGAGYTLTGLSCVDSVTGQTTDGNLTTRSVGLNLTAGERVHCTFENTKLGTVIINKATAPAGGSGFSFSGSFGSFNLDDGGSRTISSLAPGSYSVTEADPLGLGYELSGLTCTDSDSSGQTSTGDVVARTATINLEPGETVICSFTNTQDDVITVEKVTIPAGSDSFGFDGGSLGAFNVAMGQMQVFTNVTPGSYTLTEDDPSAAGYALTGLSCVNSATGQTTAGNLATRSVNLNLTAGERVHCTFENTRLVTTTYLYLPIILKPDISSIGPAEK